MDPVVAGLAGAGMTAVAGPLVTAVVMRRQARAAAGRDEADAAAALSGAVAQLGDEVRDLHRAQVELYARLTAAEVRATLAETRLAAAEQRAIGAEAQVARLRAELAGYEAQVAELRAQLRAAGQAPAVAPGGDGGA